MNRPTNHPIRNTLGPAYQLAEDLYDNAVALSQLLDAYSKRHRAPELTPDARDYLSHNLLNASENLARLRQALADSLDPSEAQCPANADSAAAAAHANSPTPTPPLPAPIAPPVARINATTALAQSTGSRWILGQADSGDLAVFNPTAHAHAAIVGATGTGKTTSVGFGLALAALRSGWHVTILDPDGGANWQPFSSHAEWHDTDRSNFPDQIAAIHHHYEKRANLANPRPCLVVIEEYGDLIRQLRTASRSDADAVDAMLDSLLQRGRKRCIHLALIDQYPQHWSPAVVGGTKFRAVFQLGPNQGAKMEEYKAASLPDVGRFLVRGTEYNSWAMDAQLPALLRQLPAPDKPRRIINGSATVVPQSPPPPSPDRSVSRSVEPSFAPSLSVPQEVDPTPPTPPNAPNERSEETRLRQALADSLDPSEAQCPANADSAAAAAHANSPTPTPPLPAPPSGINGTNGSSTCQPITAHSAATTT